VLQFAPGITPVAPEIIAVTPDIDASMSFPGPWSRLYPLSRVHLWRPPFRPHRYQPLFARHAVTRVIRDLSANQPIEHGCHSRRCPPEVLAPDRLNSMVFGVFAAVALAIAWLASQPCCVLGQRAHARFGIRLALGSQPRHLLRDASQQVP